MTRFTRVSRFFGCRFGLFGAGVESLSAGVKTGSRVCKVTFSMARLMVIPCARLQPVHRLLV